MYRSRTLKFEKMFKKVLKVIMQYRFHLALRVCISYFNTGIKKGDEVIVPAQTHVATSHAVELVGAKPIFVDCELDTGNIDK